MTGISFGSLAETNANGGENTEGGNELILTKELAVLDVDSDYQASAPAIKYNYSFATNLSEEDLGTISDSDKTPRKNGHSVGDPTVSAEAFVATEKAVNNKVSKDITLDFSNVNFTEAGVYRYKLIEGNYDSQNNFDYNTAVVVSVVKDRYIDVYVGWNEAGTDLEIKGYVVRKVEGGEKTPGYEVTVNADGTDVTFGDKYSTYDLTVKKHVTGTLGDRSADFDFTATIPVPGGSSYNFDSTNDQTGAAEQSDTTVNVPLKDSKEFTVKGVPYGSGVSVQESDYTQKGYRTYLAVNSENYGSTESRTTTTTKDQITGEGATVVNFKNEKNETTPTGVVMNIAPYAAMILGAGAFAGVFLGKKKSEDEE